MTPEQIAELRETAKAAGGEEWWLSGEHDTVWGADGAGICKTLPNIGHDPDPVDERQLTEFIAAANPATILALLDHIAQVQSENVALRQVLSECATAVGATAAPQCSVEFLVGIPAETRARHAQLRASTIEECAAAVEQHDKQGREWIRTSLWGALTQEAAARIRALALPAAHNEEKPT